VEKKVTVVVSCHFSEKDRFCYTTMTRILKAMRFHYGKVAPDEKFVATGNVSYEKGSKTLAELIKEELMLHGARDENVLIGEGVGIFSESRTVPRQIKDRWPDTEVMEVVSSDWYFWPAKPLWKKFGKEQGLRVEITPVKYTGGLRTELMYAAYASIVRTSLLCGLSSFVEKKLTVMQSTRKEGFTMDGCR